MIVYYFLVSYCLIYIKFCNQVMIVCVLLVSLIFYSVILLSFSMAANSVTLSRTSLC